MRAFVSSALIRNTPNTWQGRRVWDSRKNVENMIDIGKKENFYETQEKLEIYVQRVEQFFLANNIEEDPQVPTLLSWIGSKTYTLLRDLLSPDNPAKKSFQKIVTTLQQHLSPKPLEIAKHFRFNKRNRREG